MKTDRDLELMKLAVDGEVRRAAAKEDMYEWVGTHPQSANLNRLFALFAPLSGVANRLSRLPSVFITSHLAALVLEGVHSLTSVRVFCSVSASSFQLSSGEAVPGIPANKSIMARWRRRFRGLQGGCAWH
jgi:hypothetical protein